MLTRDSFLAAPSLATVEVDVPALGGTAVVRQMTVGQRDAFEIANAADKGKYFRPRLVAASVIDQSGSLMFGPADLQALAARAGPDLEPIVDAATKLNRYAPEEVKALEGN